MMIEARRTEYIFHGCSWDQGVGRSGIKLAVFLGNRRLDMPYSTYCI